MNKIRQFYQQPREQQQQFTISVRVNRQEMKPFIKRSPGYLVLKLQTLIVLLCVVYQSLSQPVYKSESKMQLFRFDLIVPPKYLMRNTPWTNWFSTPHHLHQNRSHVLFGITYLNFHQSSASLSWKITNVGTFHNNSDPKHLNFRFTILNQTVLYRIKLDVALIQDQDIPEIYLEDLFTLNCKVMNQGIGYRSENFTFKTSVANGNNNFFPEDRQIYAALYYRGFNLFNPNGSYFHLNWQFYYNLTHYTVVFHTQDQNIVSFITFGIVLVDLFNVYQLNSYSRYFFVNMVNCSAIKTATCPGKLQYVFNNYEVGFTSYLFGLTKLNFTKHQPTDWEFDTNDISVLNTAYVETNSLKWVNMTVLIIGQVTCAAGSDNYDPYTQTCVAACPATGSPYQFTGSISSNPGQGLCRKCDYTCPPGNCSGPAGNQCTSCNPAMFRQSDGNGGCQCMTGHFDVKTQYCPTCWHYVPGCVQCSSNAVCTQCNTNMQLTANNTCVCTQVQTTTRNGTCPGIVGCLVYFNDNVRSSVCIQCNITQNFVLFNYSCNCIAGYSLQSIGGKWICMPLAQVCGDGIRTISEPCDDGNTYSGDGCNSTCGIQIGYLCVGNLRQTSFCFQNISNLTYVGAMKLQGQDTVDLYFQLYPYNVGFDNNISLLQKYMNISVSNVSSMNLVQIFTQQYYPDNKLRIQFRYNYTNDIDPKVLHNLTLNIYDRSQNYTLNTSFYMVGTNLRLNVLDSYGDLIPLNYVMLVLVILAFLVMFISLFTQNWIGIETLHTFQFCYFYYVLLQNIDQRQVTYLSFLEFCNGFNRLPYFMSLYEYVGFNRKIYLMGLVKEVILNFNFMSLLLSLPLLLFAVKLLREFANYYRSSRRTKGTTNDSNPTRSRSPKVDYLLSSQFIIGRVFITFNLIFMNIIIFSFFINQTHLEQQNQIINDIFQQFYLFVLLSSIMITIGMLIIAACRPFKYDEISSYDEDDGVSFVKFKRFNPTYPIVYTSVVALKIIFLALFYADYYSSYILLTIEILFFIGFLVVRPYRRVRSEEGRYCYSLHNLHNLWNSVGLIVLIIVLIIANSNDKSSTESMNTAIKFVIFAVQIVSLIFAYLRLLVSKRLGKIARTMQKEKQVQKDNFDVFDLDNTDRTLKRNASGLKKDSAGNKSLSRIKNTDEKAANRTRQPTGKSLSRDTSQARMRQIP